MFFGLAHRPMQMSVSLGVIVMEIHVETDGIRNGGLNGLTRVFGILSVLARERRGRRPIEVRERS